MHNTNTEIQSAVTAMLQNDAKRIVDSINIISHNCDGGAFQFYPSFEAHDFFCENNIDQHYTVDCQFVSDGLLTSVYITVSNQTFKSALDAELSSLVDLIYFTQVSNDFLEIRHSEFITHFNTEVDSATNLADDDYPFEKSPIHNADEDDDQTEVIAQSTENPWRTKSNEEARNPFLD